MKLTALIIGVALGAAGGVAGMMMYGYRLSPPESNNTAKLKNDDKSKSGPKAALKQPSAQARLASLVTKLDILIGNAPMIELSKEARGELARQLHQLEKLESLDENDAEKRIAKILAAVGDDVENLRLVGFRIPGKDMEAEFSKSANPFEKRPVRLRLVSLQRYAGPPPMKIEVLPPPVLVKSPKS